MTVAAPTFEQEVDGVVLRSFNVPGARVVHGNVFPLGLQLRSASEDVLTAEKAAAAIRHISEKGTITEFLATHGALLIRGVDEISPKSFSTLIYAAEEGRGRILYEQLGFSGGRTTIEKGVFSASEAPPHVKIDQHNENVVHTRFPSNIHFYCIKKAPRGGESPLDHNGELYDRIYAEMPDLVKNLAEKGLLTVENYRAPGKEGKDFPFTWAGESAFGKEILPGDDLTTMKAKVEKQVAQLTPHFWWKEDDSLEVHEHITGIHRHPLTGKPVWINGIAGRYGFAKARGALKPPYIGTDGVYYPPANYRFRDGTVIPEKDLIRLNEIIDEIVIPLVMEPGDLVMVDNYHVQHGRYPWFDGERKIVVSMWDSENPKERIQAY